jgi:ribosome-binding factor A
MTRRTERIAEQILEELARALRESATDPRLKLVNLLRVDVSPELSNAIVYWSTLDLKGETDLDATAKGLASASGFLRRELAHRLSGMRRIPELRFRHDPSLELGSKTLSLLSSLSDGKKA